MSLEGRLEKLKQQEDKVIHEQYVSRLNPLASQDDNKSASIFSRKAAKHFEASTNLFQSRGMSMQDAKVTSQLFSPRSNDEDGADTDLFRHGLSAEDPHN